MAPGSSIYANQLRRELASRNRMYASGCPHVESYGGDPVIVYAPEAGCHGNFFDPAFKAIMAKPEWSRRFNKVHAQGRSLPKPILDPSRKWRELDSCMSSDALLMNIFCAPGVAASLAVRNALGVDSSDAPVFGWKARVPLKSGLLDRTEVDMRWGDLLVEAKLTESSFQTRKGSLVETYRDFDAVFDRDLLPRMAVPQARRKQAVEFPEDFSQEWESAEAVNSDGIAQAYQAGIAQRAWESAPTETMYEGYQLIRNVLAAHAAQASFCVMYDERRPDLREAWFRIMSAVKDAGLRVRLKTLTWQELAPFLPQDMQRFLESKYGIAAPGRLILTDPQG